MNYTEKEIELALIYMQGQINDIQLNFLSFKNKTEAEKIKKIAQEITKFDSYFKKFIVLFAILICFLIYYFA